MNLLNKSKFFSKLANEFVDDEVPTQRGMPELVPETKPEVFEIDEDAKLQAYEFVHFMNRIAFIKNKLYKIQSLNRVYNVMFSLLSAMRPGTIANSIKEMLESDKFDPVAYRDLRDSTFKEIEKRNLSTKFTTLSRMIEVDLLSSEEESNKFEKDLNEILKYIRLVRPILLNGLSFID